MRCATTRSAASLRPVGGVARGVGTPLEGGAVTSGTAGGSVTTGFGIGAAVTGDAGSGAATCAREGVACIMATIDAQHATM